MLQYLSPKTLEEMYKEINTARLEMINEMNKKQDILGIRNEYRRLTNLLQDIEDQYNILTNKTLCFEINT